MIVKDLKLVDIKVNLNKKIREGIIATLEGLAEGRIMWRRFYDQKFLRLNKRHQCFI